MFQVAYMLYRIYVFCVKLMNNNIGVNVEVYNTTSCIKHEIHTCCLYAT